MKLGIVIYSVDPEIVWNAFRLAILAQGKGDAVDIFLLAQGVEVPTLSSEKFNITQQMQDFVDAGGSILSCKTCLNLRGAEAGDLCPVATMQDLYALIETSDKVITF
jgi:uncharacterized protein involved in oxidation of intracellular sulfur